MYTLEGVSSVANFITAYEASFSNEPAHDKTYSKTCATSEACASVQSNQSLR